MGPWDKNHEILLDQKEEEDPDAAHVEPGCGDLQGKILAKFHIRVENNCGSMDNAF